MCFTLLGTYLEVVQGQLRRACLTELPFLPVYLNLYTIIPDVYLAKSRSSLHLSAGDFMTPVPHLQW